MQPGDLVKIAKDNDVWLLWDRYSSHARSTGRFHASDVGVVLDTCDCLFENESVRSNGVKVLCSNGDVGWLNSSSMSVITCNRET